MHFPAVSSSSSRCSSRSRRSWNSNPFPWRAEFLHTCRSFKFLWLCFLLRGKDVLVWFCFCFCLLLTLPPYHPTSLPSSHIPSLLTRNPLRRALLPPSCPNGMCALSSPTDAMQPASGIWNASLAIITEHMAVFRGRDNIKSTVYK